MLDLLLLIPVLAVIGTAALVVRRERAPEPVLVRDEDPAVDLTFLRATPREVDLRIEQLTAMAAGTLGGRMRTVQLARDASRPPVVRSRRRRERPLVAAR